MRAIVQMGMGVHEELRGAFDDSTFCYSWMIDGQLGAIGGVSGPISSDWGEVWLAVGEKAARYPIAMMKEATLQLSLIMQTKRELVTSVLEADPISKRFAEKLGFEVDCERNPVVLHGSIAMKYQKKG
jgi:hypothetical protein